MTDLAIDRQGAGAADPARGRVVGRRRRGLRAATPTAEFAELHESAPWQQTEVLRYDHYIGERRLGTGLRADDRALLRQTGLHLEATYRVPLHRASAALLYRTGEDFQGLHSDRELRWLDDTRIAIVVLGQRRPFVFRQRVPLAEVVERIPAGADPDDIVLTCRARATCS